jgi:hypothetical protein
VVGVSEAEFELSRRPAWRSALVPAVVGSFAVAASAAAGALAALVTVAGVVVLVAGVLVASHRVVDAGGFVAFLGFLVGAVGDASAAPVVLGVTASVVAWDAGGNAVSLGRQLGRGADTVRVETLHALTSATVGVAGAVVGLLLFVSGPTRQPVTTLFVLVLAGAALVAALDR